MPAPDPLAAGRAASIARRRASSRGKAALPPASERVRTGVRAAGFPAPVAAAAGTAPVAQRPAGAAGEAASCRELARARRAQLAQRGRQDAPLAPPDRPPREGEIRYAPKVAESPTHGGVCVTGLRIGRSARVTGDEPGAMLPVSGTQYVGGDAGGARPGAPKVGLVRTASGQVVSGTRVRSAVPITGDEAGDGLTITGEADPRSADDLTPRSADCPLPAAQFPRRSDPHGHSVFGTHLGRAVRPLGSRSRTRARAIEVTEGGAPITGSAVGRSARVTGDEAGACRAVTGDQYLTPARAATACGGTGGGTAAPEHLNADRRDPVTGTKVTEAQTWGAQRVTGPALEHRPNVSGDEPGSCRVITGTPYQGASMAFAWCPPATAVEGERRLVRRAATTLLTGDVPQHAPDRVTGTGRGARRIVTGTPYYRESPPAAMPEPEAAIDARSGMRLPPRAARSERAPAARITGAFAAGQGKITGALEFAFRQRRAPGDEGGSPRITGEGRTEGPRVTGDAWAAHPRVTGTEGYIAAERNPSERAGEPHAFAGARQFQAKGRHEEPRQIVTGMIGWTARSAAKVTLSGGAQG